MKRRLRDKAGVQIANPSLNARVPGIAEQVPVEALIMIPFAPLAELVAHEHQLLAGMAEHVAEERAQRGALLPDVARHLVEQRAFAVHHLVMRERQNEI